MTTNAQLRGPTLDGAGRHDNTGALQEAIHVRRVNFAQGCSLQLPRQENLNRHNGGFAVWIDGILFITNIFIFHVISVTGIVGFTRGGSVARRRRIVQKRRKGVRRGLFQGGK